MSITQSASSRRNLAAMVVGLIAATGLYGLPQQVQAQETANETTTTDSTEVSTPAAEELEAKLNSVGNRLQAVDQISLKSLQFGWTPGLTTTVPTAYGLSPGTAAIGLGYQERTRYSSQDDGAIGAVIGLGRPGSDTGITLGVTVLEVIGRSTGSFGSRGSFNLKAHHRLSDNSSVALGLDNVLNWGGSDTDSSVYGVYSQRLQLGENPNQAFSNWYLSAGLGSGRFRSEKNVFADKSTVGVFGSVTTNLFPRANAFAEWSGQDLNVGLSFVPFKNIPLIVTPALADITGHAGDGTRFTLGIAYGFTYR